MKAPWTQALFAAALTLLAWAYIRFEPRQWAHYTDPIVYLSGAESFAQGNGYRFTPYVNTPKITCHPPLQSAYLSLFWRLDPRFPENIWLLYAAMIVLSTVNFLLFHAVALKSGLPSWLSSLLALAWGFSSAWGTLIYGFFSDVLFGALWLGLALWWLRKPQLDRVSTWIVTGLLLGLLYLTRSASLPLIAVVGFILLHRLRTQRAWKPIILCFVPVAIAVLSWKIYSAGAPGYADFIRFTAMRQGWSGVAGIITDNAFYYLSGIGFLHTFLPSVMDLPSSQALVTTSFSPLLTALLMVAGWIFTACWVYGFWWKGSSLDRVGGWMVLAYLLQLTIYPTKLGERALFPALPFVLIWAWQGRSLVFRWPTRERILVGATALFLFAAVVGNSFGFVRNMRYLQHSNFVDDLAEIGDWLRTNTPPETVVAAALCEPVFHLRHLSDRRVIENYFQPPPWFSIVSHSLSDAPDANYVLLSWYSWMTPEEATCNLTLVAQSSRSHFRLYRPGPPKAAATMGHLGRSPHSLSAPQTDNSYFLSLAHP